MSSTESLKLFGITRSPYSCRAQIALQIKGVQYEYQNEDVHNKSPELLQYNPVHKKVPVLVHNGNAIAESQVILEYIDETWEGNSILPKNPYERAMARFWAKFIDEKCMPSIIKSYLRTPEERERSLDEAIKNLKILDEELGNKKFFGGENIGFVDIVACFLAYWLPIMVEVSGKSIGDYPNLTRWSKEYIGCSVVKINLPDKDILVNYFSSNMGVA